MQDTSIIIATRLVLFDRSRTTTCLLFGMLITKKIYNLKHDLSSTPTLAYYDVTKPVTPIFDASKQGLDAACLQNGQPIAFASKVLAPNEQKWAQIEKELLAIVFACKKFNDYIYGKEVIIESDHKPLETEFCERIDSTTNCAHSN